MTGIGPEQIRTGRDSKKSGVDEPDPAPTEQEPVDQVDGVTRLFEMVAEVAVT